MESKNYYRYISGLKGFSCLLVMIGHFVLIYKEALQFVPGFPLLDVVLHSRISFVFNAGYWLYLFFLVSGYLVAKSQVKTAGDVLLKAINRFFRFAFPIFFSYLVIYLIYLLIGFHNGEAAGIFQSFWYQDFYTGQYSLMDVLRSPVDVLFFQKCSLVSPYWVLREMFIASIIIYVLRYAYLSCGYKHDAIYFSVLILAIYLFSSLSPVITTCLIGMLFSFCEDVEGILKKPYFAFWVMVTAMLLYTSSPTYVTVLFFLSLVIFIPKVKLFDTVFSSTAFDFLGKISWGIFSFHWPVMCSLGALIIIAMQPKAGMPASYVTACVVSGIVSLLLAFVFHFSFERLSAYLSSAINGFLKKVLTGLSAGRK